MGPPTNRVSINWERIACFLFGVCFLSAMLIIALKYSKPTEFQIFIFRIVTAISVAGIGAMLPGAINVQVSHKIKAGGSVGLFVIIYFFNPPALITDYTPFSDSIRRADAAAASHQYAAAETFLKNAATTKPESWIPYNGLGRIYFSQGKYSLSLDQFKKSFELQGKTDGSLAYNIAMNEEALNDYESATKSLAIAASLQKDSPLKSDIIFDQGLVNLLQWLNHGSPQETKQYQDAIQNFTNFISKKDGPLQWAYYHLACLLAVRAQDTQLKAEEIKKLKIDAITYLERAITELAAYKSEKSSMQKEMMRTLLTTPEHWQRKAGYPVSSKVLVDTWANERGSIRSLVERL